MAQGDFFPRHALLTRRDLHRALLAATLISGGIPFLPQPSAADARSQLGHVDQIRQVAGASFDTVTRLLRASDAVYRNDLLWTRETGQLHVALLDGGSLSLGENAEVALDDSVGGSGGAAAAFLRVLSGAFRFSSGGVEKPAAPPKIETPFAVLSLRGTEVFGGTIDKAYSIFVISGEVGVANAGGQVILKAGEGTMLTSRDKAPTLPKVWPAAKVQRAKAMLRF
jgi:hypothetical protein